MIKKVCISYKSQDHPMAAIYKSRIMIYSTKQKENESISNYILSIKNLSPFLSVIDQLSFINTHGLYHGS